MKRTRPTRGWLTKDECRRIRRAQIPPEQFVAPPKFFQIDLLALNAALSAPQRPRCTVHRYVVMTVERSAVGGYHWRCHAHGRCLQTRFIDHERLQAFCLKRGLIITA